MIDPRKELFKWGPIDFKLVYGSVFIEVIFGRVAERYKWLWPPCLALSKNEKTQFIIDNSKLQSTGLKYFKKYLLNIKNYKIQWQKWEDWVIDYTKLSNKLDNTNLAKVSNKELHKLCKEFYELSLEFWLIVHVPEIANWGGEYLLQKKLEKIDKEKSLKYLEILSASVKYSFFQKEELKLLSIGKIKDKQKQKVLLKKHAENYKWLLNSYGGNRVLSEKYFASKLEEFLKDKKSPEEHIKSIKNVIYSHKMRKKRLIKNLRLDKEMVLIADQLSQSIWWQDLRKSYIWKLNFYYDRFFKEIVKRYNWKFTELQACHFYEILRILKNDKEIKKSDILKRKKNYMLYAENGIFTESTDKKYVKKLINKYTPQNHDKNKDLKGLVVSKGNNKGMVKGRAKIIRNPFKDAKKMHKGDILIASMTSPEFIVVMRKASAIITDHGGMTSHAAIVSRELKVPCIVATKHATKVLKDNDLILVDANKGIVKKLQ